MAGPSSMLRYLPLIEQTETDEAIRLLNLLPGQIDDELHCVLYHAPLSRPPAFEALSYTWGNPKGFRSLTPCKGDCNATYWIKVGKQNKTIGYNLLCALRSLRQESSIRTLWVDAICINQEDDQEKSEQVNKMARIFGRATRVLAWLGEVDEFVDLAFDTVRDFCWATKYSVWQDCSKQLNIPIDKLDEETVLSTIKARLTSEDLSRGKLDEIRYALQSTAAPGFPSISDLKSATRFAHYLLSHETVSCEDVQIFERIEAVTEIFVERAYWRRLWIVQELLSAKDVLIICGPRQIDLKVVALARIALYSPFQIRGSLWLRVLDDELVHGFDRAFCRLTHTFIQKKATPLPSLGEALNIYKSSICSEARDNIYSLLNITKPIDITINYSLSPSDIFTQCTRAIMRQDKTLDILFLQSNSDQGDCPTSPHGSQNPSWVPKFSERLFNRLGFYYWKDTYNAGGPLIAEISPGSCRELHIWGLFSGRISRTLLTVNTLKFSTYNNLELWESLIQLRTSLKLKRGLKKRILWKVLDKFSSKKSLMDLNEYLFWATLVMDSYSMTFAGVVNGRRMQFDETLENEFIQDLGTALSSAVPSRLIERLRHTLQGKNVCVLDSGVVALVQGNAEAGDVVFVAHGASAPLVLRAVNGPLQNELRQSLKDARSSFNFVGGAFILHMMDGQEVNRTEYKEESIQLV